MRGSWRPNRTAIFWPPLLWPSTLCLFVLQGSSTGGPEAHSAGFLYYVLFSNFSGPQLIRAPRAPSAWCGFPYHISSITPSPTVWLFVLTELYNSSTPTQSPTRSLEWHVWPSSSGNNCHAVQRSLSSGASVYESIVGFFTLSHFISKARPRDLFRLLAIGMYHFLPVHHFIMAYLLGPKVKIQQ